jgi:hypothetical protein
VANYAENRAKLSAFVEQQKSEAMEFQTKVLEILSAMLSEFVARKKLSMDSALEGFLKSFEERVEEIARLRTIVDAQTDETIAQLTTFDKENSSKKAAMIGMSFCFEYL